MRVLVTGGAGFIGSQVVEQLVERGADVVVLDSLAAHDDAPDYLPPVVDLRIGDLMDEDTVRDAVHGVDAVCHQAARVGLGVDFDDVTSYVSDNDLGTASLLRALWRRSFTGRLVVASSMVVYGEGRYRCAVDGETAAAPRQAEDLRAGRFDPPCPRCGAPLEWVLVGENAPLDPRNVYAATKVHTEQLAFLYGREAVASVCALRYHNVYGPRMPKDTPYAGVASIFRSAYEAGRAPRVFEDGGQMRDFVHVRDVARANVLALDSSWSGACNIASGQPHSVLDMATALAAGFGAAAPAPQVTGEFRLGDVRHVVASAALAGDVLGFRAEVGFDDGMAAFAKDPLR
ncbi:NAD-dependent epimerase/dehydratase family protein [Phytoactinopolyspora mesophila]|uniref:NAD-dependent epimerase/dehydratase family protein n=1 Tax=Phytoactinopolyspora mesophila TaxID=2650750 RepID=A0A7K3M4C1_9ACTN|nr:NAD-dependent epimerase/dehydratase family protein [Phytoactinopolyspora mesophila]NDL58159.1 NAD-dependent epimerase/dehydratase family protein [Phytoactinopolyspora mesophila]